MTGVLKPRTIDIEGVGPVLFEGSRRARRTSISVRPFKGVRVAVPRGVSLREAEAFLKSKAAWVKKHMARMKEAEREHHALTIGISELSREEAGKMLVRRLDLLSQRHGLPYNRVFIRNQATRWGSCTAKHNINLNYRLAALPNELIDYVIIHELVHTKVMNHGRAFWARLEKHVPGAKGLDAMLRGYRLGLR